MSSTEVHNTSGDAAAGYVDMHLEVQAIPVSQSTGPSSSTSAWADGSTTTSPR